MNRATNGGQQKRANGSRPSASAHFSLLAMQSRIVSPLLVCSHVRMAARELTYLRRHNTINVDRIHLKIAETHVVKRLLELVFDDTPHVSEYAEAGESVQQSSSLDDDCILSTHDELGSIPS
jgi:hypothetical protein